MKLLFEDLEGFIAFLKEANAKELFYSVRVEASDLTETPEGVGRLHRATILLQAPIRDTALALHFAGLEQFVSTEKEAKKFGKAIEEKITEVLDEIKKSIPELMIYKGVVEL